MNHRREFLNTAGKSLALASLAGALPTASAAPQTKSKQSVDPVTNRRRGVGLLAVDHQRSAGGYTLFTPQTDEGNVYLIDIDGAIAHRWKLPNRPGRHAVLLPNGNLVIQGRSETQINAEVRELTVAGIVRPEDITSSNTIKHTQIAEARISYGGRGDLSRVQKTPAGTALVQRFSPF